MRGTFQRLTSIRSGESGSILRERVLARSGILACLSVLLTAPALSQPLHVSAVAAYDHVHQLGFGVRSGFLITEVAGQPASYFVGGRVLYYPNQYHAADPNELKDVNLDNSAAYLAAELGLILDIGALSVEPMLLGGVGRTSWKHIFVLKADGHERRVENRMRIWYAPGLRLEIPIGRIALGGELRRIVLGGSTDSMHPTMLRDVRFLSMQV